MNRLLLAALLLTPLTASAQAPAVKVTHFPPDAATRQVLVVKTAELKAAVAAMDPRGSFTPDVAIYLKSAEWALRHDAFSTKDSVKQTLAVLDAGLDRATAAREKRAGWRKVRGKAVVRGYMSRVDGSVQPYALEIPETEDLPLRFDIVLHGRDATLTEVKFLAQVEAAKPRKGDNFSTLHIYGRGNNGYRWAGDVDIYDAYNNAQSDLPGLVPKVLRGFSMGGAGTWHYGLHHPYLFRVLGPGAGFTSTHGYVGKLPNPLPDYQERCLRIYDAVAVAENVFNVPVVAYSGEKDKQKAAADNIVNALTDFREPHSLTHLVAPGLEHKMPSEWTAKADAEYRKHIAEGDKRDAARSPERRVRYVLYTTAYADFGRAVGRVTGLERHYDKAVLDLKEGKTLDTITTSNIRSLALPYANANLVVDGQAVRNETRTGLALVKADGKWAAVELERHRQEMLTTLRKSPGLQGPIDDAFMRPFAVAPAPAAGSPVTASLAASHARFAREWDKYLRGELPTLTDETPPTTARVLFGGYASPMIAAVLPKLPVTWSADALVVNGVTYDAKTHYPVLITRDPLNLGRYLVLNSGHTFHAAEFEGSNAQLYPRLGDWAVLKVAPTKADPAHTETVAAGLFDEEWKFAR